MGLVLVLQHDHNAPAGLLGDWLAEHAEVVTVRLDRGERPPEPAGFDRVVTLGSEHAADDDGVAWQADEQATLRAADAAGVPVLGVCFGAQALARALGGGVRRAARPELGWVSVGTRVPGVIPDGPWLAWHDDEVLAPPGAQLLAANASGVQAYRAGRHVGIQFHPEVTPAIVAGWKGSPELVAETERRAGEARERAFALFAALLARP
ncbi:MAG: type 1 glutamine amidotransferase [Actinobacteria bacterium]|nr:MAG: type 1 glutamine amidotransferase [Actinomycetota bacterium]